MDAMEEFFQNGLLIWRASIRKTTLKFRALAIAVFVISVPPTIASGVGGGGTKVDTIKISKCFYQAGGGQMLIKASSSDPPCRFSKSSSDLFSWLRRRPGSTLAREIDWRDAEEDVGED